MSSFPWTCPIVQAFTLSLRPSGYLPNKFLLCLSYADMGLLFQSRTLIDIPTEISPFLLRLIQFSCSVLNGTLVQKYAQNGFKG